MGKVAVGQTALKCHSRGADSTKGSFRPLRDGKRSGADSTKGGAPLRAKGQTAPKVRGRGHQRRHSQFCKQLSLSGLRIENRPPSPIFNPLTKPEGIEAAQAPQQECRLCVALRVGRGYPPALSLRAKGSLASLEPASPEVLKKEESVARSPQSFLSIEVRQRPEDESARNDEQTCVIHQALYTPGFHARRRIEQQRRESPDDA